MKHTKFHAAETSGAVAEQKTPLEAAREKLETEAKSTNDSRKGIGTRVKVGSTRGKNPQAISFEAFDESKPDTLPKSVTGFMETTKAFGGEDEPNLLAWLIEGFNSAQYTAASDPIAEFVNAAWPEDVQKGFRLAVRSYSVNAGVSIEDAVALIKPGIEASQVKKTATA